MNSELKLRIAVDFGTTFSAVCYTFHTGGDSHAAVGQYAISKLNRIMFDNSEYQEKTQIAWNPERYDYVWGEEVDEGIRTGVILEKDRIRMLKIGLLNIPETEPIRTEHAEQLQRIPLGPSRPTIEDLIRIYLERLYLSAKEKICNRWGKDIFENSQVECLVCVPALWTPEVSEIMISAAEQAGLPNPDLVSEPEAAAAFMMQELHDQSFQLASQGVNTNSSDLRSIFDEPFVIADIGGGTADFITYIVESQVPTLKMSEAIGGTGGLCGSAMLNRHFREFFANYVKNDIETILRILKKPNERDQIEEFLDYAVEGFEISKRYFGKKETNIYVPGLPQNPLKGWLPGRVVIPARNVENIFAKILDPIVNLIKEQVMSFNTKFLDSRLRVKSIVFVGGLSGNPYALEKLQGYFSGPNPTMGYEIQVICPSAKSETVIAQGALLRGIHKDAVVERYLRRSFGTAWDEPYDPAKHGTASPKIDPHDGVLSVQECIHWLYRVDEPIRRGQVRQLRGWRCVDEGAPFIITEVLYGSDREKRNHLQVHDLKNDIKEIGRLWVDVSHVVDRSRLPRITHPTDKKSHFERLDYAFLISFDHPRLKYEIIIPKDGQFPNTNDPNDFGPNPYRQPAFFNCAAAFDVTKQDYYQTPPPSSSTPRTSKSKPTPRSKANAKTRAKYTHRRQTARRGANDRGGWTRASAKATRGRSRRPAAE